MRTRFLNNDYFALPPSQRFLHLPVPRLHAPPNPSAVHYFLQFASPLPVSHHLEPLPISAALSAFLSAVLPHKIHFELSDVKDPAVVNSPIRDRSSSFSCGSVGNRNPEQDAEPSFEEKGSKNCRTFGSDADIESPKESKRIASGDENGIVHAMVQFETPELDALLENVCFTEKERMQMLYETPEVENCPEMLNPEPSMQFPYEALESISLLENVISEYLKEEDAYSFEDNVSVRQMSHSGRNTFLTLEVDEESLGIPMCLSMVEIVGSYFDSVKSHDVDKEYQSITDGKELLGSLTCNMEKFFSGECVSKQSLVLSDMFPESDFINMLETELFGGNTALQGRSPADSDLFMNLVSFQEIVFLDEDFIQTIEAFYDSEASDILQTMDWMFTKEHNFKSFDELIVSNEIALIDDTFKSMPVPIISDNKKLISLHDIIGELFSNLKTRPLSVSDGIYLNWDLLEKDECNYKISNWHQKLWAKIDLKNSDFGGQSFDDGKLVFDLVFSGDTIGECDIEQSEEFLQFPSDCMSLLDIRPIELSSAKLLEHGSSKQGSREQLPEKNAERTSLLFKSMAEITSLDYFLNPQKATVRENCNFAVESTNANACVPKISSTKLKAGLQSQGWHTVLHTVKLSENIVTLAGYFEKCYLSILESDTQLLNMHNSGVDYFKLLSVEKHKLMQWHVNGNNMAFIVLSAIKQAAWYLCFYGLHPASLYVNKLSQNLDYLRSRLGLLQSVIKEENRKVDTDITVAHPSLIVVKEILQSNIKRDGLKVLIVAEQVLWWSLKNLLFSLRLSFSEQKNSYGNQPYTNNVPEDSDTKMEELTVSDCLLVSYKHVSPLFPFNKFGIILEYGGPHCSSRISELSPNSLGLPHLHFLAVELDDHAALKALCEGVEMPPNADMLMESETYPIFNPKATMTNQKLEKILNFCPVEESYDIKSSDVEPEADDFVPLMSAVKTEHGHQGMETFAGSVIIVNTQNIDKEMIFSRRSSYQAILAMEKGGIQVVERDLDLPIDIILSSAICLAWYDSKNLGKKATPVTEASSSLHSCIENIATDVLTMLSFYFRGCFLVFEGEFNFLSTVMEFSDGLYAAAAGLGIDLQIFFSYSPELTSEVIVSSIKIASKLTRGLYPKMPESVTLAESFLTQFPGINPLTAHSILSSGTKLNEFLCWSHEQRMHVLERYHVPEESLSLFSVFCRYLEREDSKSIMTDCSSSVSSGPDSDKCYPYQVDNERKRKTRISSYQKDGLCFDEFLQFDALNQVVEAVPDSSTLPKLPDLGMSKDTGISSDFAKASLSMGDLFGQKQRSSATPMRNPPSTSQSTRDQWNFNAARISEQLEQRHLSFKHKELAQNDILDTTMMGKNLNWHNLSNSEKLHEDVRGEVVDLTDYPLSDKNFSVSDFMNFPSLTNVTEKDHIRKNKIARRLSFDNPDANSSKICRSSKNTPGEVGEYAERDFRKDVLPLDFKNRENIFGEGFAHTSMRNKQRLPFQEEISHLGRTPLSSARWSASPLKNSPWTTEFINRFKEKSKSRQKSVSCEKSAPWFGYPGNISNVSKRRSPSIIELFKYQSSETPGNIPERKRQKQSGQSSNSVKKGRYSAPLPSCTPNDKISTKTLTFGRKGSGSQTKLMWSDGNKLLYQAQ